MPTHKFDLSESFEIDGGSLDGLNAQKCFVLGAEWEEFNRNLSRGGRFSAIVHQENASRLVSLAERHGRFVEFHVIEDSQDVKIIVGDSLGFRP